MDVLLDLALGDDASIAADAAKVLKTQVYLYDADMARLGDAFKSGNAIAKDILESYAAAEFFTKLPDVPEEIKVVTYIAGTGDISTDLLSPGNQAHSRADRELHGQCLISPEAQQEIKALQKLHPDKSVMLIAEKGTMGVGSSRMSGVNNVALWTGKPASPYVPFVNFAPIVAGTNGISPIFLTTVDVTGGTINSKDKKLYQDGKELKDISKAFTPQKMEFMKAGGSYAIVFGKKLQTFAAKTLGIEAPVVFAPLPVKSLTKDKASLPSKKSSIKTPSAPPQGKRSTLAPTSVSKSTSSALKTPPAS